MNKTRRNLGRRSFLKGIGASAALLPFLPVFDVEAEEMGDSLRRLIVFWTPNCFANDHWKPIRMNGASDRILQPNQWSLTDTFSALQPYKQDLTFLEHLDTEVWHYQNDRPAPYYTENGSSLVGTIEDGHEPVAMCLTGAVTQMVDDNPVAQGPSIDQYISRSLRDQQALVLGIRNQRGTHISYEAAAQPVPSNNSPMDAFANLFADIGLDEEKLARLMAERRSVIDLVRGDLGRLRSRLPSSEKEKMDRHLEALRGVEDGLQSNQNTVQPPDLSTHSGIPEVFTREGRQQIDIMVAALASDLYRVGTLMWSSAASAAQFPWLGSPEIHHAYSHFERHGGNVDQNLEAMERIERYYIEQFAYLLSRLTETTDLHGNRLLDSSAVMLCTEHGFQRTDSGGIVQHDRRDVMHMIAGTCGGRLQSGLVVDYNTGELGKNFRWLEVGRAHNDLLITLAHAMGLPETTAFGAAPVCQGPLTEILA